jgi:hypothetical protein
MNKVLKVTIYVTNEDDPDCYSDQADVTHHMTASEPHDQAEDAVRAVEHKLREMLWRAFRFEESQRQRRIG